VNPTYLPLVRKRDSSGLNAQHIAKDSVKGDSNGSAGFQPKAPGSFAAAFAAAKDSVAASDDSSVKSALPAQAELKQAVIADPVVQRLFNEFQARLVEVRAQPASQPVSSGGDEAGQPIKR
jgi:hypothetical protein